MTRKHYREIADILSGEYAIADAEGRTVVENITASLADVLKRDNSRFDLQRFYMAALGRETVREYMPV